MSAKRCSTQSKQKINTGRAACKHLIEQKGKQSIAITVAEQLCS